MKDNSKIVTILLAIIAIVVVVISLLTKTNDQEKNSISIVTNASEFYTVTSCLYRTVNYALIDDRDNLLLLLNQEYKKENKVTKNNVLELFNNLKTGNTFVSEKMYYEILDKNLTKYYVSGHVESNEIYDDEILEKNEYNQVYFIVYLDSSNNIFSIEPYDGKIFKEGVANEG